MTNKDLADLIFPNITKTIEDYKRIYPERNLPDDAVVTRAAPSPTGYTHMGTLFQAFIAKKVAKDTNGVFYIRIEDTDRERLVPDAVDVITTDLKYFEITQMKGFYQRTMKLVVMDHILKVKEKKYIKHS